MGIYCVPRVVISSLMEFRLASAIVVRQLDAHLQCGRENCKTEILGHDMRQDNSRVSQTRR